MYNCDIICEYQNDKNLTTSDDTYRNELLKVFNLTEYDDAISKQIECIYEDLKSNEKIITLLKNIKNMFLSENSNENDLSFNFILLFSYDYFYMTHELIKTYKKTGTIGSIEYQHLFDLIIEKKNN